MKRWIHAAADTDDFSDDPERKLLEEYFEPYGLSIEYYPGTDSFVIAPPELPYPFPGCQELPRSAVLKLDNNKIESIVDAARRALEKYRYSRRYITEELRNYLSDLKEVTGEFALAYASQDNSNRHSTVKVVLGPMREFAEQVSGEDPGSVIISRYPKSIKDKVDDRLNEIIDNIESLGFTFYKRVNDSSGGCFRLYFEPADL